MTVHEKFDRITALIESEIKENKSSNEIAEKIAKENAISQRDLSTCNSIFCRKNSVSIHR